MMSIHICTPSQSEKVHSALKTGKWAGSIYAILLLVNFDNMLQFDNLYLIINPNTIRANLSKGKGAKLRV